VREKGDRRYVRRRRRKGMIGNGWKKLGNSYRVMRKPKKVKSLYTKTKEITSIQIIKVSVFISRP